MDQYAKDIDRLIREKTGEIIANCSTKHAVVLLRKMFEHANDSISIFSGSLDFDAYSDTRLIAQMNRFLLLGKQLIIVVEKDISKENPIWSFYQDYPNQITMLKLDAEKLTSEPNFHFAVMDKDGYRFEGDKRKHAAIAGFGDKDFANKLLESFKVLRSCSDNVACL